LHANLGTTARVNDRSIVVKKGNSQAVRIPAELAYNSWDIELLIERQGDELRIRPDQRRLGDMMGKLTKFSPDFMAEGRGHEEDTHRPFEVKTLRRMLCG